MCSTPLTLRLAPSIALAFVFFAAAPAAAGTLEGRLVDSLTGTPIPDAEARVVETDEVTTTDDDGRWAFDLPEGTYELRFEAILGDEQHAFRLVRQRVPQVKPADSWIATTHFIEQGVERLPHPVGAPTPRIPHPSARDRGPVDLRKFDDETGRTRPGELTIPDMPSETIRVGRRSEKDNCDNPVVAIEEMTLDEYVRGVLPPEIGVFRNLDNAGEVYEAFAYAAKSYGLYFTLVYGPDNRRTVDSPKDPHGYEWFHIDDTPCNQRYSDRRLDSTDRAADATAGELLVKNGEPNQLDKFEYAASCAEHGTRPEYQDEIVPDDTPVQSCVGDWCGHDTCAGHADHPDVPGEDRCLVRGICQWGAAEWAESGEDASWILEHYQPNLEIRQVWEPANPETVAVEGYVHTDSAEPSTSGVTEATVDLDGERETTTDDTGLFFFDDVELSRDTIEITAQKAGYESNTVSHALESGETNRIDVRIERIEQDSDTGMAGRDVGSKPDAAGEPDAGDTGAPGADRADRRVGQYGGLGPLLTRSRGARREGCSNTNARDVPGGIPLSLLFLTMIVVGRRRLDGSRGG